MSYKVFYSVFYRGTRFSMKDRYSGVTNQITAFVTTRIYIYIYMYFWNAIKLLYDVIAENP